MVLFSGAWIWKPLMDRLRAAGHSVEAFDLPGLGDDRTPAKDVTLDACAARLCEVLAGNAEPAIVVGNSMGGIIATQGAANCPERVAALVYVAAFVPQNGQSLLDLTKLPEELATRCRPISLSTEILRSPAMPAEASRQAIYGSCAEDVAAWAIARQRPQPVAPFATPVSIQPGALDGISRYYVLCRKDRAIPPPLQRRMIAENGCADVIELDTDHTPHLSMTNELAEALQRFATHASSHAPEGSQRPDCHASLASLVLPDMKTTGSSTWAWLTAAVLAHLAVSVVHGAAHAQANVPLSLAANLFVYIVILAGPLIGLALTWPAVRIGSWLIAVTMAGALVFGVVNHFMLSSPDHVAHVDPQWRPLFETTAILLAVTEALSVGLAIRLARERSTS